MGWIKLHRDITDNWLWQDESFSRGQAWIDLLLLANSKDEKFRHDNQIIEGKRGNVYRSITYLSERWKWSRKKTRAFLKLLESDGMVTTKSTTRGTTITIINYGFYQDSNPPKGTVKEQSRNSEGTVKEQSRNSEGTKQYIEKHEEYIEKNEEEEPSAYDPLAGVRKRYDDL